jgi:hypothetical protein
VDFFNMTGKVLSGEWLGHLERRVVAAGGSEQDAHCIYDSFHEAKKVHRKAISRNKSNPSKTNALMTGKPNGISAADRPSTSRLRAEARKKFANQLQQSEDTVFCLPKLNQYEK